MSAVSKKALCFYFQVHQPFRLKRYRFFDIGNDHYYYDDFSNESILQQVVEKSFLPANKLLLEMIEANKGKLNDDISFRFSNQNWSNYPLTADKFIDWINQIPATEQLVNLFMNYETFG